MAFVFRCAFRGASFFCIFASMRDIKYIVIHCTAGNAQEPTKTLKDYFKKVLGWKAYGYHIVVNADGTWDRLTEDEDIANGVKGHNHESIHISWKGGSDLKDTRTMAQKKTLRDLVMQYRRKYPKATILGHRDLSPDLNGDGKITSVDWIKFCPCFDAKAEYRVI